MTTHIDPLITRPGGHSAKNARRAGAPNTHQSSGENPMVGTISTVDASTVTQIHTRLAAAGTSRFLTVDGAGRCVRINLGALAELVDTLLREQTKDLRAECAALAHVSDVREREIVELIGERDVAEENDRLRARNGAVRSGRGA